MSQGSILNLLDQLDIDPERFEWQNLAACKNLPFDMFFDQYEKSPTYAKQVDEICAHCPVAKECFSEGTSKGETGVWGGFYLTNGKISRTRNKHKTPEIIKKLVERGVELE